MIIWKNNMIQNTRRYFIGHITVWSGEVLSDSHYWSTNHEGKHFLNPYHDMYVNNQNKMLSQLLNTTHKGILTFLLETWQLIVQILIRQFSVWDDWTGSTLFAKLGQFILSWIQLTTWQFKYQTKALVAFWIKWLKLKIDLFKFRIRPYIKNIQGTKIYLQLNRWQFSGLWVFWQHCEVMYHISHCT